MKLFLNKSRAILFLIFLVLALLIYGAYSLGFSGALYFDDFRPLSGLEGVTDTASALAYVFSDSSGPLGRPLAMLSFLFNRADWPDGTEHILRFNALLHLLNGLLVACLAGAIARLVRGARQENAWLAVGASILWMVMPIQVSTSLIAVQRMAGLSAFFVFSGLLVYVQGIRIQLVRPLAGLALQVTGIGVFTLLAMFSKENGVLLPVLALVFEVTLFAGVSEAAPWRRVRVAAFSAALGVLVAYLGYLVRNPEAAYQSRNYSLYERLITEPGILLDYLRLSFIPDPYSFHPFHDAYPLVTRLGDSSYAQVSIAVLGVALFLACALRRRYPVAAFAVLWFFAAHLLESTVIGLELYFEHRNYVALFGPCLALAWSLTSAPPRFVRVAVVGFLAYIALMFAVLFQVTSLWGNRLEAAQVWAVYASPSPRASEHYALMLLERQQTAEAWKVITTQADACPDCVSSQVQAMLLSCVVGRGELVHKYYEQTLLLAQRMKNVGGAPSALAATQRQIESGACRLLSLDDLIPLNKALLKLRRGGLGRGDRLALTVNLHQIASSQGNNALALDYMWQAWGLTHELTIGEILVTNLIERGELEKAETFAANEMCAKLPGNPYLARRAQHRCEIALQRVANSRAKQPE